MRRGDGIPTHDADARARSLAEFFGAASPAAEPMAGTDADAVARERLAEFFDRAGRPDARPAADARVPVAAATAGAPAVLPVAADAPAAAGPGAGSGAGAPSWHGQFGSAPRGMRAWGRGAWWAVGISVALVAVLVAASVYVAQTVAAQEAEMRAAVADFEEAVVAAEQPVPAMDAAFAEYETAAAAARAAGEGAGPALAAVAGMSDQAALDAAVAANAAVIALLDTATLPERPAEHTPPDAATIADVAAAERAAASARAYEQEVVETTAAVVAATTAVTEHVAALAGARRALGAGLPATAEAIVDDNPLADAALGDGVVASAAAVGAAQAAGGSGDPELLAYAAAVTALRDGQLRAEEAASRREPEPQPEPDPQPEPQPEPPPQPQPEPQPVPEPTEAVPTP